MTTHNEITNSMAPHGNPELIDNSGEFRVRFDTRASMRSDASMPSIMTGFGPLAPKHPQEPFIACVNPPFWNSGQIIDSKMMQKRDITAIAIVRASRGMHNMAATSTNSLRMISRVALSSHAVPVSQNNPSMLCTKDRTGGGNNFGFRALSL